MNKLDKNHWTTAVLTHNAYQDGQRRAIARRIAAELREEGHAEKEYITIPEARRATGWAEATLQKRLRGKVPMVGKGSYSRAEFFKYLTQYWKEKQDDSNDNYVEQAAQRAKSLAMLAGRR